MSSTTIETKPSQSRQKPIRKRKPRGPKKKRLVKALSDGSQEVVVHCAYNCGRTYTTLPCHIDRNSWHRTLRKLNAHEAQRCRLAPNKTKCLKLTGGKNGTVTEDEGSPASTASSGVEDVPSFSVPKQQGETTLSSQQQQQQHRSSAPPPRRGSGERAGTILAELKRNTEAIRRASGTSSGSSEGEENEKKTDTSIARALMSLMSPRSSSAGSVSSDVFRGVIAVSPRVDHLSSSSSSSRRLSGIKRMASNELISPTPQSRRRSVVGPIPGARN